MKLKLQNNSKNYGQTVKDLREHNFKTHLNNLFNFFFCNLNCHPVKVLYKAYHLHILYNIHNLINFWNKKKQLILFLATGYTNQIIEFALNFTKLKSQVHKLFYWLNKVKKKTVFKKGLYIRHPAAILKYLFYFFFVSLKEHK